MNHTVKRKKIRGEKVEKIMLPTIKDATDRLRNPNPPRRYHANLHSEIWAPPDKTKLYTYDQIPIFVISNI